MKKERAPVAVGLVAPAPGTVEKQVKSITPERPRKLFELTLGGRAKMPAPSIRLKSCWVLGRLPRSRRIDRFTVEMACLDCDQTAVLDLNHDRVWCAACDLFGNLADILAERGWPTGPFKGVA